jgi:hypothetical protein
MQAVLANLGLRQRSELGRAFELTIQKRSLSGNEFTYMAMHVDFDARMGICTWLVCSNKPCRTGGAQADFDGGGDGTLSQDALPANH